mmetsp:Transcript_11076/g.29081  ORF Transcript_11076/g.29081 Transcript_11076/m.29081 type:complete len:267 (-) Transcript_11076:1215-2015(-)
MSLPTSFSLGTSGVITVEIIGAESQPYPETDEGSPSTGVTSITFYKDGVEYDISNHSDPLTIFIPLANGASNMTLSSCLFWDETEKTWRGEGCTYQLFNEYLAACMCTHLTDFAGGTLVTPAPTPAPSPSSSGSSSSGSGSSSSGDPGTGTGGVPLVMIIAIVASVAGVLIIVGSVVGVLKAKKKKKSMSRGAIKVRVENQNERDVVAVQAPGDFVASTAIDGGSRPASSAGNSEGGVAVVASIEPMAADGGSSMPSSRPSSSGKP